MGFCKIIIQDNEQILFTLFDVLLNERGLFDPKSVSAFPFVEEYCVDFENDLKFLASNSHFIKVSYTDNSSIIAALCSDYFIEPTIFSSSIEIFFRIESSPSYISWFKMGYTVVPRTKVAAIWDPDSGLYNCSSVDFFALSPWIRCNMIVGLCIYIFMFTWYGSILYTDSIQLTEADAHSGRRCSYKEFCRDANSYVTEVSYNTRVPAC